LSPTCNSSSSSAPWPRAWAASSGWMAARAPVLARTRLAARTWLRLVSRYG
jgi:hypothetical protein